MNLIRNLSKYTPASSEIVVIECKGIFAILACLKDVDPLVSEVALQTVNSVVRDNANFSPLMVDSGKITLPQ